MSDNLEMLRRASAGNRPERPLQRASEEPEPEEDRCAAFGFLRGTKERGVTIEFRLGQGSRAAFPYSWLGPVIYDPSVGILLKFVGDRVYLVLIEGSNLDAKLGGVSLYERGLLRHRVTFVRAMSPQEIEKAGEGETVVERIRILSPQLDDEPHEDWFAPFRQSG